MTRKAWDHGGKSRHERGYGTAWEKLRAEVLASEPLCRPCFRASPRRTTIATAVDHIVSKAKGGTDDRANLQSICMPCHGRKSIEEGGGKPRRRKRIGADGWPVDE